MPVTAPTTSTPEPISIPITISTPSTLTKTDAEASQLQPAKMISSIKITPIKSSLNFF